MHGSKQKDQTLILSAIFVGSAIFLYIRSLGLYPRIFADEYTYSYFTKYVGLVDSGIPSFLFYSTYGIITYFANDFLWYARVTNILFYVAGGWFVFLTAKSCLDYKNALIVTAVALFGTYSIYTHFFMPEAMFYFGFWLFIYLFLRIKNGSSAGVYLIAAFVFGCLSLVKPHALLFMPACLVFIVLQNDRPSQIARNLFLFVTAALVVKLSVGVLLTGANGLTLFGSNYSSHASSVVTKLNFVFKAWPSLLANLLGNVAALCFVYGPTLPVVISENIIQYKSTSNLSRLSILILLNMLFVVIIFTTTVSIYEENQDYRVYFRYYGFMFPLLFISVIKNSQNITHDRLKTLNLLIYSLSFLIVTLTVYLYLIRYQTLFPYVIYISDIPEMFYLLQNKFLFVPYGIASIASILLVLTRTQNWRNGYLAFLLISTILLAILSFIATREDLEPGVADKAGIFVSNNLKPSTQDSLIVAGSIEYQLQNVLFYASSPKAKALIIENGSVFQLDQIPSGYRYVLLLSDVHLPSNILPFVEGEGFLLVDTKSIK